MKQSFLNGLKGMHPNSVKALCHVAGYELEIMQPNELRALVAVPRTVILWLGQDGRVASASAGDPLEVEIDE